jgi:hypothetical protein
MIVWQSLWSWHGLDHGDKGLSKVVSLVIPCGIHPCYKRIPFIFICGESTVVDGHFAAKQDNALWLIDPSLFSQVTSLDRLVKPGVVQIFGEYMLP